MSRRALDAKGLAYQVVDVTENDAVLVYVKELGYLTAPVVVVSEHDHWGGFRPDEISRVAAGGASEDETVGGDEWIRLLCGRGNPTAVDR